MNSQVKVGLIFVLALVLGTLFTYYLGVLNPFSRTHNLVVAYNFAGGVEVGSPVRVMGIKVGKVKEISFAPDTKMASGEEAKLLVTISISKDAWTSVREDSQFFINLAGVIGEKFVEVSPGSANQALLKPGQMVRGEDPPRIDQLISQSYGLAGKIFEFVENNEGSVVETITMLNQMVDNFSRLLKQVDSVSKKPELVTLFRNLTAISSDVAFFTKGLKSEDGQKTIKLVNKLLWRLDAMDAGQIRKFLQKEGIKANLF